MRIRCRAGMAILLAVSLVTAAVAQRAARNDGAAGETTSAKSTPSTSVPGKVVNPMAITPAREAAALKFAELYHSELAGLLKDLKPRNKRAYRQAIRQLYLDSERLAKIREVNPRRYDGALDSWKLDSRIRLLAARVLLVKNPDPRLEEQLRKALGERVDLKMRQMIADRDRTISRLKKLDVDIAKLQTDRDAAVEQQLKRVKRSLGIRPKKAKGKRRKANARKTVNVKQKTAK